MKKNPEKIAKDLLEYFGGKENIKSVMHCATRLRVEVKNNELVNVDDIKKNRRCCWILFSK